MNQDLDDRLIPNGEYRDAQNISVGKSEADDIGALETVLGNTKIPLSDLLTSSATAIGTIDLTDTSTVATTTGQTTVTGNYENALSPIDNIAPKMSVHKVTNGVPGGELALVGSSTYNTIVVGKTISKTTPFNAAPGDVWEFSGDYATQTAITDATQYEIGSVVYMTLLGTPTVSSGSIFAGMQIYNGTTKVGEITEVPAFAWPNVSVTSITCSLTEVVPVSTTLTFKAGSIFLSGDYSASIERGMRAKVTSGFAAGNIVDVITAIYDANSRTTQVVYDASTNSNHLGTDGNIISFYWPLEVIGYKADEINGIIYTFLTDNNSALGSYAPASGLGSHHYITKFQPDGNGAGPYDVLLTGSFLNFSQQSLITGVSLIENLLFWTDNRNQPRKINITQSLGYYTQENQISVAKYNPYLPISLLDKVETTTTGNAASPFNFTDTVTQVVTGALQFRGDLSSLPPLNAWNEFGAGVIKVTKTSDGSTIADSGADALISNFQYTTYGPGDFNTYTFPINVTTTNALGLTFTCPVVLNKLVVADATGIKKGMYVVGGGIVATDYIYVTDITGTTITLSEEKAIISGDITFLITTMSGETISNYFDDIEMPANTNWPGDPDYLEGRFVRFSYRFEFDDGEYSLMAPFTQAAFIPKQRGYFINGDEDSTYRSTIVDFMENGVQNIDLKIPLPDRAFEIKEGTNYKISNIEILYKESDQISIKVLDRLAVSDPLVLGGFTALSPGTNEYIYNYQSRKPIRTLPQAQTTRVYDKVPVRAFAQETAGNRIIYGNYQSQHTAPSNLTYYVTSGDKNSTIQTNWAEYPNHSLKQNRNYQVGFVLADKFGRSSDVILSSVEPSSFDSGGLQYGGSTVYTPYNSTSSDIRNWFGEALQVVVEGVITQLETPQGAPGLYAETIGSGYNTFQSTTALQPTIVGNQYTFNAIAATTAVAAVNSSPTTNIVISPGNTDIEADMNVFGGTIPLDTKVIAPTNSTNFVVNKSVTGLVTSTALSFYDLNAIPIVGSYLRGQYIDFTKVTSVDLSALPLVTVTTEYPINPDLYLQTEPIDPDRKYAYTLSTDAGYNATGWYSYKVVVRQQEQEYYNVYLPGILSGYPSQFSITPVAATTIPVTTYPSGATLIQIQTSPNITIGYEIKLNSMYIATINSITSDPAGDILGVTPIAVSLTPSTNITIEKPENFIPFPNDPTSATANIVLINDNINKVPRDLAEVGPDQKQFRSSVQLFGRVTNIFQPDPLPVSTVVTASNKQYYPGIQSDTAVSISTAEDANVIYNELSDTPSTNFNVGGKDNLYQIDTNPLVSRLSTNIANPIGVVSDKMLPYLAVYETEPVESVLDIFWETTQSGLIADLNADVLNGYDGAVDLSAMSVDLTEAKASGDYITGYFYSVNTGGVELPQDPLDPSFVAPVMVVKDGTTPTANTINIFTLEVESTAGVNYGRYRIKLNTNNVPYLNNSSVINNYQFTFTVTYGTDPAGTIIKNLPMTNVQPYFDAGNSFSDVVSAIGTTSIVQREARNGSSNTARNQEGLYYSITTGNGSGYFEILQDGTIQKTVTPPPIGNYPLTIRVSDAYDGGAVPVDGTGWLYKDVVQTVIVGEQSVNSGVISGCRSVGAYAVGIPTAGQLIAPLPINTTITGGWYLTAASLSSSDSSIAAAPVSTTISAATADSDTWSRLGSAELTQGTIAFSLNMSQRYTTTAGAGSEGNTTWKIFHRTNSGSTWALIADINNMTIGNPGPNLIIALPTVTTPATTAYKQLIYAYDTPGEYLIIAISTNTRVNAASDGVINWVNSTDLYHSNCVVYNGYKTTTGSSSSPPVIKYDISSPTATWDCTTPTAIEKWAQIPYQEYVTTFYTSSALTSLWTPAADYFYSYDTDVGAVPIGNGNYTGYFTGTIYTAKFSPGGIKISGGSACTGQWAQPCTAGFPGCGKHYYTGSNNTANP